jgi:hypothetical protein
LSEFWEQPCEPQAVAAADGQLASEFSGTDRMSVFQRNEAQNKTCEFQQSRELHCSPCGTDYEQHRHNVSFVPVQSTATGRTALFGGFIYSKAHVAAL